MNGTTGISQRPFGKKIKAIHNRICLPSLPPSRGMDGLVCKAPKVFGQTARTTQYSVKSCTPNSPTKTTRAHARVCTFAHTLILSPCISLPPSPSPPSRAQPWTRGEDGWEGGGKEEGQRARARAMGRPERGRAASCSRSQPMAHRVEAGSLVNSSSAHRSSNHSVLRLPLPLPVLLALPPPPPFTSSLRHRTPPRPSKATSSSPPASAVHSHPTSAGTLSVSLNSTTLSPPSTIVRSLLPQQ